MQWPFNRAPAEKRHSKSPFDENIVTQEISCPVNRVGALIGAKGCNTHEILKRAGCKVKVSQDDGDLLEYNTVVLTGTQVQVDEGRALAEQLIQQGWFDGEGTVKIVADNFNIDPERTKEIIGTKGSIVGDIMKRTCCKVPIDQNFPPGTNH